MNKVTKELMRYVLWRRKIPNAADCCEGSQLQSWGNYMKIFGSKESLQRELVIEMARNLKEEYVEEVNKRDLEFREVTDGLIKWFSEHGHLPNKKECLDFIYHLHSWDDYMSFFGTEENMVKIVFAEIHKKLESGEIGIDLEGRRSIE